MSYTIDKIKKLRIKDLPQVASDIRKEIIDHIKITGGHLSSNLGMVELTVALHYVFNSPYDKLIFDVSHQTYAHKILTGRLDQFSSLRKFHGLSGFACKKESIHDAFEAGHSSTSISAGLGFLESKSFNPDFCGEVIAIIGDASVVNGLSMEAINYLASKKDQKMIIILNDNEMGISKNTGGLAKTFNHIRVKGRFKLVRKIMPRSVKLMMKSLAYKNNIFSSMGLKYIGVVDGHNIKELVECLEYAKKCQTSIVIHVKTIKGKGLKYAEEDKTGIWHSTPAFCEETGIQQYDENSFSFGQALCGKLMEEVKDKPNIRVITPGMGFGSGIDAFEQLYPKNYIDVGIAEENAILMATSMAEAGLLPVVFVYSTFLQRAYDELIHDMARNNVHAVICLDRAGIVDGDGPTHQGIFDVAYLSTIPNVNILAPRSIDESKRMIEYALEMQGTYVIRYPKTTSVVEDPDQTDITKWKVIKQSKNNKYIISYGPNLNLFQILLTDSEIGLINARSIKPFDTNLVMRLVSLNQKLFFFEEVCQNNSLGSQVICFLNSKYLKGELSNFYVYNQTLPNSFLEVGQKDELLKEYGLDMKKFIRMVEEV